MISRSTRFTGVAILLLLTTLFLGAAPGGEEKDSSTKKKKPHIIVGSKAFTEAVILGETIAQLARESGVTVEFKKEMGGSRICFEALKRGDIDIYPEYTGTIRSALLPNRDLSTDKKLRSVLEESGIKMTDSLGFENTYILGMRESLAEKLGVSSISDLKNHPGLTFGFTNEFMDREKDGWPPLRDHYNLQHDNVRGIEHNLAYIALSEGKTDVIDVYSTDAKIKKYNIRKLKDDRNFFPEYRAVILYRQELEQEAPNLVSLLKEMEGTLSADQMVDLNARVAIKGQTETEVARSYIADEFDIDTGAETKPYRQRVIDRLLKNTADHLKLVFISLLAAIAIALPLGIVAAHRKSVGQGILGVVGILQTIPALAMFVFMIPILSVGEKPAIAALFLYSLLPIVRNTYSGLDDIPLQIKESAAALGLSYFPRLFKIELPMATRSILAGIKISAVINVGTATLGAFIGAGGYGQPIFTGLRLNNIPLILEGAIPASLLALAMQGLFEIIERMVVSRGLRLESES